MLNLPYQGDPLKPCPLKRNVGRSPINAVVVAKNHLFVGSVPAGFRSVIHVWKRTYGALRVAGFTGSALTAEP